MNYFLPNFTQPYALISSQHLRRFALSCLNSEIVPTMALPKPQDAIAPEKSPLERALYLVDGEVRDGVAIIPIQGEIYNKATYINQLYAFYFGGTITEWLCLAVDAALADPGIKSILFRVDTPGGDAIGLSEASQKIFDARSLKTVWAHVEGGNFSAGFYLSSACSKVFGTLDSSHGSIGSVLSFYNFDKMMAKMGIEEIEIVSTVSPDKRPDETTPAGKAKYQQWVDSLGDQFVEAVARNRDVSVATVLKDFGKGWIKTGHDAVDAGMIDGVCSFEATFSAISQGEASPALTQRSLGEKTMSALKKMLVPVTMMFGGKPVQTSIEVDEDTHAQLAAAAGEPPAAEQPTEPEAMTAMRQKIAAGFAAKHGIRAVADQREDFVKNLTELHVAAQIAGFDTQLEAAFDAHGQAPAASEFGAALASQDVEGASAVADAQKGDSAPSPERIAELLAQTPLGQQALAALAEKGAKN